MRMPGSSERFNLKCYRFGNIKAFSLFLENLLISCICNIPGQYVKKMKADDLLPLTDLSGSQLQQKIFTRWVNVQLQDSGKEVDGI